MPDATAHRSPPVPAAHQAFLTLVAAAQRLLLEVNAVVKQQGVTEPQFNALRILRGAGPGGLPCGAIAERMITRVPDITRLTDRLEGMGLAERRRGVAQDRRVVHVVLTAKGRALLKKLDEPVRRLHQRQFHNLSPTQVKDLIATLEKTGTAS